MEALMCRELRCHDINIISRAEPRLITCEPILKLIMAFVNYDNYKMFKSTNTIVHFEGKRVINSRYLMQCAFLEQT